MGSGPLSTLRVCTEPRSRSGAGSCGASLVPMQVYKLLRYNDPDWGVKAKIKVGQVSEGWWWSLSLTVSSLLSFSQTVFVSLTSLPECSGKGLAHSWEQTDLEDESQEVPALEWSFWNPLEEGSSSQNWKKRSSLVQGCILGALRGEARMWSQT